MTPEAEVKQDVDKWLKIHMPGAWRYRTPGGPFGKGGVGDYIIVWKYTPIMIEAKADSTCEATALQAKELKAFSAAGGVSCLLKGFETDKLNTIKEICLRRYGSIMAVDLDEF